MQGSLDDLKIGVSACFMHADPQRPIFTGKTLQYMEQSTPHWIASLGALPVMIPAANPHNDSKSLARYAQWLDALVLEGGADMWPGSYGEEALKPQWNGDRIRDEYEIALIKAFVNLGKPVFGICRGLQVLNVAFGGSLYQDIATQVPDSRPHRDAQAYDQLFHTTKVLGGTQLARLVGENTFTTNSVHHQGIKKLAPGFSIEAQAQDDGIIEAIRWNGTVDEAPKAYVAALQWHPEFHHTTKATGQAANLPTPLIDDTPLLRDFLSAALTFKLEHA